MSRTGWRERGSGNLAAGTAVAAMSLMLALGASCATREQQGGTGDPGGQTAAARLPANLPDVPPPDASAARVPQGYRVEVFMKDLDYPTSVEFDDAGNTYVAEAGYAPGDPTAKPRILKVSADGNVSVLAGAPSLTAPVNDLLWHDGRLFVSHRGKISVIEGGGVRDVVTDLPSWGDHQNNQLTAGPDGRLYIGQGTATNSGVVGLDNFQMGWVPKRPDFRDIAPKAFDITGETFATANPLTPDRQDRVRTSPFSPFGTTRQAGYTPEPHVKGNGTILRVDPDGTNLDVYAWGLRNPYGVLWAPDGKLYATENGFDVRGSRPIANDTEDLYEIEANGFYGWPDAAGGIPVTDARFKPPGAPQPRLLMQRHPELKGPPLLTFPRHAAIAKLDASKPGAPFGQDGQLFIAFFGNMTPMTGDAPRDLAGYRVARVDPRSRQVETFFGGTGARQGRGSGNGKPGHESVTAGLRRPLDVRFTPAGDAMYVADFGTMVMNPEPQSVPGTGVIWRIVPEGAAAGNAPTNLSPPKAGR